jgi:outer membrane protein TolC
MTRVSMLASAIAVCLASGPALAQQAAEISVEQAVQRALEHGYEVAEIEAEIDAARASHRAAKALYGPRIMLDAKAFYFNERPTFELDLFNSSSTQDLPLWLGQALDTLLPQGAVEAGEQYNVDFSVTIAQPLTKLESIAELSKVRGLDVEIAQVKANKTGAELAYQVREAAFQLLKIQDMIDTLAETEGEVAARQKQVQAFRDAELVGPEQVLEVGVKLAEVRQGLIRARAFETVAVSRLRILLRLDPAAGVAIAAPGPAPALPDLADCVARAREIRPELAELRLRTKQAEAGVRAKMQEFVPDISLVARYQYQAGSGIGQPEIAAGAVMSWTPFAWGETYYAVRAAKAQVRQASLALERVEQLIGLDVERAHAEARAQLESIAVAEAGVQQAEELYRIEQARFDVRDNTATDLLAAQTSLLRARSTLSAARYDYLIAIAALRRATGEP